MTDQTIIEQIKAAYIEGLVAGVSRGNVNAVVADDARNASRACENATLQSSAVLPSEAITDAMIEAGAVYLDRIIDADMSDLRQDARRIYTAMRATTPTEKG
jgi:hypothetical protein